MMRRTRPLQLALLCLPIVLLGGCATTKFQCPAPNGIACMSAPGVYQLTNAPGKAGMAAASAQLESNAEHHHHSDDAVITTTDLSMGDPPAAARQTPVTPLPKPGDVIPLVEPARVMRIWIGPWQDADGNLHMASRVYTEIQPKHWSVGIDQPSEPRNFYPLQVGGGGSSTTTTTDGAQAAPVVPTATSGMEPQR